MSSISNTTPMLKLTSKNICWGSTVCVGVSVVGHKNIVSNYACGWACVVVSEYAFVAVSVRALLGSSLCVLVCKWVRLCACVRVYVMRCKCGMREAILPILKSLSLLCNRAGPKIVAKFDALIKFLSAFAATTLNSFISWFNKIFNERMLLLLDFVVFVGMYGDV